MLRMGGRDPDTPEIPNQRIVTTGVLAFRVWNLV